MGKTVTMRKGDRFADICDSPETIAQAQKDGYHLCDEAEAKARGAFANATGGGSTGTTPPVDPATPIGPGSEVPAFKDGSVDAATPTVPPTTPAATGLAALSKKDLLEYIGKRKLFEKSYKDLEPAAIIPKVLEKARDKIVEAGLKTAYEVASIPEHELFILFDTLK